MAAGTDNRIKRKTVQARRVGVAASGMRPGGAPWGGSLGTGLVEGRMRSGAGPAVMAAAHVQTGSARGVDAWAVARAVQAVEEAAAGSGEAGLLAAVERLGMAVDATRSVIIALLRAN